MRTRLGRFVVASFALALVAAACGDDDAEETGDSAVTTAASTGDSTAPSDSTPDTDAPADSTADSTAAPASSDAPTVVGDVRGVTDTEIIVGGVSQLQFYPGIDLGVEARFARENEAGGVNGRTLTLAGVQDDGSDAAQNLSITRSLVQSDGVFAVLPVASAVFLPQSSDFLVENHVPYFGWGFSPGFCNSEWGFGFNGCLISQDYLNTSLIDPVITASGKDASELKVAVQAGDDDAGRGGNALYQALWEAEGADVVYNEANIPVGGATTDYTPFVQAILEVEPDIVFVSTDFPSAIGLSGTLNAAGFAGMQVAFVTYNPGLLQTQPDVAAALEGQYINIQVPPQEEASPAIKQFEADLEAIGEEPFITLGASIGYWQADVFIQMLKAVGPELTPESLSELVNSGEFTYEPELEGAIGPMTFPDAEAQPTPCSALVQVKDGAYVSAVPFDCYEVIAVG
jgi:branched-chain amino acid transport system substrate-binding protein